MNKEKRGVREDNSEGISTEKAVEFIREMLKGYYAPRLYAPRCKRIINLLQQGEENKKYKAMWGEYKKNLKDFRLAKNRKWTWTEEEIRLLEQKYFPKGEINE